MKKIGIIGIGKLGLCFALNLEKKGYEVLGVDISQEYVNLINSKKLKSDEPLVEKMLSESTNFKAFTEIEEALKTDIIFVVVATPSKLDGEYDHTQIENIATKLTEIGKLEESKELIISCTTMPGYCENLHERISHLGYKVSYNPEFIAQGTVIKDQLYPDMVLIGESDVESGDKIQEIYSSLVENSPMYCRMNRTEAEITKIALNCFLTTKIAYANMVGDVALASGVNPDKILSAIGSDTRIGHKYLKYGYGFGGPCFPRDNRAFAIHADSVGIDAVISKSTDDSNRKHLEYQAKSLMKEDNFTFHCITYKPESTMIEESQQLALANKLSNAGKKVHIVERKKVIEQLKKIYGNKFTYTEREG